MSVAARPHNVLVIDDDTTLLELLSGHLEHAGYRVVTATTGAEGLRLLSEQTTDLAIVDVMMPGMDGWEVCRRIRLRSGVPVIMLTAKSEEVDKLRGFSLGVDDYVTKPFSFAELTARIGAVLGRARAASTPDTRIASGDLVIDLARQEVTRAGERVELTPTEFRLLEALAREARRTLSTDQLVEQVWGYRYAGETEHVKHYVWSLRRKLERDPGDPRHVLTVRGFGYRFE
ncbi:MAG: response regulator transcription factor [Thermoleophilia bacterium]|nr:response regulator transcription factor [Thermoleophilia bacterium]